MPMQPNSYHEATTHSYWSVRKNPNFLDWSKQPTPFKIYPSTYPFIPFDMQNPLHRFLYRIAGINAKKVYPGVEYYLRTIPSAGALYPTEIYFQARKIDGLEDGIYHLSVAENGLRLLHTIKESEGVESFFEDKRAIEGFVFLYSTIYYRSSWKYKNRAFRYCLLDAGHALGSTEASAICFDHAYHIHYRIDLDGLNEAFGFGDEEFFLSSSIVGKPLKRYIETFTMKLEHINGTGGIYERNPLIEEAYIESKELKKCKQNFRFPSINFDKRRLEEAILNRRSIRQFTSLPIKREQFRFVLEWMDAAIPSDCDEKVQIWCVVNRVEGLQSGLYLGDVLQRSGDFSKRAGYLCLEQALGQESAVTFFLTGSGQNYRPMMQKAGHIGHRCYIASEYLGLGCSGIGAFYDEEVKEFLQTEDMVLYALAIGR